MDMFNTDNFNFLAKVMCIVPDKGVVTLWSPIQWEEAVTWALVDSKYVKHSYERHEMPKHVMLLLLLSKTIGDTR